MNCMIFLVKCAQKNGIVLGDIILMSAGMNCDIASHFSLIKLLNYAVKVAKPGLINNVGLSK